MAIIIADLTKTDVFVWSGDPDKGTEKETRFHFRMLDSYERGYLQDQMSSLEGLPSFKDAAKDPGKVQREMENAGVRTEMNKVAILAFRMAVTGIDNLMQANKKPVEFETESLKVAGAHRDVVADRIVRALPSALFLQFYVQLMKANNLTEEDEGNSEKG
tara:strand:- start:249 stop:728 length:480 start_codon:yes stop_codon:yes gene_type:complete